MILYDKLWKKMKERGISQYKLINNYKMSHGQLNRLRKNEGISMYTLGNLCKILDCKVEDIIEYIPESK